MLQMSEKLRRVVMLMEKANRCPKNNFARLNACNKTSYNET